MSFNDGDFVRIDYTARRASDNSVAYTTVEKVANDEKIYDEKARYAPQLIIIGKNDALRGVENAVRSMVVGEEKKATLKPEDAFGQRNEQLVSVMHLSDFREKDINPMPGMQVNVDGRIATIKSVNSGRVVVDLNHQLAGETLIYDIKVIEKLDGDDARVKALAENYSLQPDAIAVSGGVAKIVFGEKVEKNADYLVNKSAFAEGILKYMERIQKVVFEEEYARPAKKQ
ncbi:MAG: peptidylprolyl isomerase [Candidatus Marsarchaeota archaeon]|nr:peptidylprolyl isomerase [Candidatus Marsarchaeota archaeon]MCL5413384.1 peptidylprolyl isomerase [Candidatus Marsarchaeota archaeon]